MRSPRHCRQRERAPRSAFGPLSFGASEFAGNVGSFSFLRVRHRLFPRPIIVFVPVTFPQWNFFDYGTVCSRSDTGCSVHVCCGASPMQYRCHPPTGTPTRPRMQRQLAAIKNLIRLPQAATNLIQLIIFEVARRKHLAQTRSALCAASIALWRAGLNDAKESNCALSECAAVGRRGDRGRMNWLEAAEDN
jgi:hypothetical protein